MHLGSNGSIQAPDILQATFANVHECTTAISTPRYRSMEHVPVSRVQKGLWWHLHNLLVIDKNVNHLGPNTKVWEEEINTASLRPLKNNGTVSRVAHMFDACSRIKYGVDRDLMINRELSVLKLQWNAENPVTDFEKSARFREIRKHIYILLTVFKESRAKMRTRMEDSLWIIGCKLLYL